MNFDSLLEAIVTLPDNEDWRPSIPKDSMLDGVPYAPYSKADKLFRMADWTEGKDKDRYNRNQYGGRNKEQQSYGANQIVNPSLIHVAEDEATFSVVDNTRTSNRMRTFGRSGSAIFRGRGLKGGRGSFQRVGSRMNNQNDSRNNRGGRGNRRFGWRDDKPQRARDASVNVKADWLLLEEIDFARLNKLNLETADGETLGKYGFLYYYDTSYDKQLGYKMNERKLRVVERAVYNVTTSCDPVIQELSEANKGTIFITDTILSMLMCAPRSVYSWDVVITKQNDRLFFDKRDGSNIEMVTVNENAADAPVESADGKDTINSPNALMLEATHINNVFPLQLIKESEDEKLSMENENPFHNSSVEVDPPASKAYYYKRFDLSLEKDEKPLYLIARTEVDAVCKTASGEDQFVTIKALNEFDSKAPGNGGALNWRLKLSSLRGAVVATEMKNNSCKLARWTVQSILAGADVMKIGFVSRRHPKSSNDHGILGVLGYKPRDFAGQINLKLANGWGIVRTIADMCLKMDDGRYILVKDPNKPVLRLYQVPDSVFEEEVDAPTDSLSVNRP